MALYVIGDLHLSLGCQNKPMDIFKGWENHVPVLKENWIKTISNDDVVVLAGDTSWAMKLNETFADFDFINQLPGKKILLKGNHDYWWSSKKKMEDYFTQNGFSTLSILHNNHFQYMDYGICGTRGWVNMPDSEPADAKVLAREVQRLEVSVRSAIDANLQPIVFLHYPPVYGASCNYDILDVLYKYNITKCYYGHIHGTGHKNAVIGQYDGIFFDLIASDFLHFAPKKVV